jgi:hypothetical protein
VIAHERAIRRDLTQSARRVAGLGGDVPRRVLAEGRYFPPPGMPRPRGLRKLADKACYANAYRRADEHGWTYCEGFALVTEIGPVVQHAWCVDEAGDIVETTWNEVGGGYLGIEFDLSHVRQVADVTGAFGSVLEADWAAANGFVKRGSHFTPADCDLKCDPPPDLSDGNRL